MMLIAVPEYRFFHDNVILSFKNNVDFSLGVQLNVFDLRPTLQEAESTTNLFD